MASNIAIEPTSGRPYIQEGANDATLVEDPSGRGAYLLRGSVDAAVDHNDVYRSVDRGASWELVASGLPLDATITDPECLSYSTTLYRVTAISDLPSSADSEGQLEVDSDAIWISGGDGYGTVAKIRMSPSVEEAPGLVERTVQHFAGRTRGVEMSGVGESTTLSVSGAVERNDADVLASLRALSRLPAPALLRWWQGRRAYVSLSDVRIQVGTSPRAQVSMTAEEVSRD